MQVQSNILQYHPTKRRTGHIIHPPVRSRKNHESTKYTVMCDFARLAVLLKWSLAVFHYSETGGTVANATQSSDNVLTKNSLNGLLNLIRLIHRPQCVKSPSFIDICCRIFSFRLKVIRERCGMFSSQVKPLNSAIILL